MLSVNDLHVHYGRIPALQGVSLEVPDRGLVAVLGSNGAGKTTLLRAISGVLRRTAGSIVYDGKAIDRIPYSRRVTMGIVQVPEGRRIFPELTVYENLRMGTFGVKDRRGWENDLKRVLDIFPVLGSRLKQLGGTLSGGEQSMLAIGRALMTRPRLLLMDEPSMGLAPQVSREIMRILERLHTQGATVLLVEQSARLALQLANYAYILVSGRVALAGTAEELMAVDGVRRSYLGIKVDEKAAPHNV